MRWQFRVPIAWKFLFLLALIVPSLLAVSWVGDRGMRDMKTRLDAIYDDNLASTQVVGKLSLALTSAEELSLRMVGEADPAASGRVLSELQQELFPEVDRRLADLIAISDGPSGDQALADQLRTAWQEFEGFMNSPEFIAAAQGPSEHDRAVTATVERMATSLTSLADRIGLRELQQAQAARQEAERTYQQSLALLRTIVSLGLLLGVGATVWLIRSVVGRVRAYSSFSTRVAAGELYSRVEPRGHDELTDLGRALNELVARGETASGYDESQAEFTDAILLTQGEEEAHELLKRHLERSIPGNTVVVLNRNNSADRLEATTELPAGSQLIEKLGAAHPRDCLALRLARPHDEVPDRQGLFSCGLCRQTECLTTCWPLLVSGEVTGSVLMNHAEPLTDDHRMRVKDSVAQAAPVLSNLRNLAIAELRAATDSLTGLPNARAVQDTLKQLVAQASRMIWPLGAVLLDLDHFKQVNDTLGHGKGDEALAAVGAALKSVVRDSDFVGRYGGEEFVMLLPDTGQEGTVQVCERVRMAIEDIRVLGDGRIVTASFGVAVFPDDAPDSARLMRNADRALYQAKANGRNRVEVFSSGSASEGDPAESETATPAVG